MVVTRGRDFLVPETEDSITNHQLLRVACRRADTSQPDGTVRHVRFHGVPCRDDTGKLSLAGTLQDITEIRQSIETLQAMSRTLLGTLEAMADAFYTLDRQWRFTYLNKAAERLLRRPRHELLGKVLWDAHPELAGTDFGAQYESAMERRQPTAFEEYYSPLQAWKDVRIFPTEEGLATFTTERDVLTDPNDAATARTILGLSHTLGLEAIAEGVETADQRNFLAMHGCRAFQGFLFGRPVTAEQF